jgi:hypothetical protein
MQLERKNEIKEEDRGSSEILMNNSRVYSVTS